MSERGLWDALRDFLPANGTPLLEKSIRAVEELPGVGKWKPRGPYMEGMIFLDVVRWGFPFTLLTDIPTLDTLRKEIGTRIGSNLLPDPSDYSEISAAALAKALGARQIQRVKEKDSKTPDFSVCWENDLVEMEVTRADPKQSQIDRMGAADRMNHQIRSFGRACDIVIHVANILCEENHQQILQVARELEPGSAREIPGRWQVRAEMSHRKGNYHVVGERSDSAPAWWPEEEVVRLISLEQIIGGPEPYKVHPQVRIQFGTPVTGYLNSAAKKANHFQGSGDVPFIIALDVMALPGAFDLFPRELNEYFKIWPRISGVLLIHGPALIGFQIGWMWNLIKNPGSRNPLPDSMLIKIPNQSKTSVKAYDLISGC